MIDTHAHLPASIHGDDAADVLERARAAGVTRVIDVATTIAGARDALALAERHDGVYACLGIHPHEAGSPGDLDELRRLLAHERAVAVGETGLDYYWDRTAPAAQQEHFRRHIDLAKRVGKTLMIHDRDAHADVLRILGDEGAPDRVVFHAFSGDAAMARECTEAGYVLSFPGVITFKNAPALREAAAAAALDAVLVETDAPFLTPHPFRGRPNAPSLLPFTLRGLAAAMNVDEDELCAAIRATGQRLFGISFT